MLVCSRTDRFESSITVEPIKILGAWAFKNQSSLHQMVGFHSWKLMLLDSNLAFILDPFIQSEAQTSSIYLTVSSTALSADAQICRSGPSIYSSNSGDQAGLQKNLKEKTVEGWGLNPTPKGTLCIQSPRAEKGGGDSWAPMPGHPLPVAAPLLPPLLCRTVGREEDQDLLDSLSPPPPLDAGEQWRRNCSPLVLQKQQHSGWRGTRRLYSPLCLPLNEPGMWRGWYWCLSSAGQLVTASPLTEGGGWHCSGAGNRWAGKQQGWEARQLEQH